MTQFPAMPPGDPSEQAIYWLTLLTSGEADAKHRLAFQFWLEEQEAHRRAWQEAQTMWQDMAQLTEADFADLQIDERAAGNVATIRPAKRRHFNPNHWAMAACLLFSVLLWQTDWSGFFAEYTTSAGEQQSLRLADGSTVLLNTDSAVSVDYSDTGRRVTLHRGQAWFQVVADVGRPFEVVARHGVIRALGTAFDVAEQEERVVVTVYEHAVRVTLDNGETLASLPEGASVSYRQSLEPIREQVNVKETAAWHRRQLIFHNRPLREVVAELNRYRKGHIFIADAGLNELRLTGVFDTNEQHEALRMIQENLGLNAYSIADRWVLLRKAQDYPPT
ncbi:FecR family protein [Methylomonas methanica]|uniref:Anti-FecI sigma factor, FecR n=1 Tax=Methylomonas methanica (strain DSM 25384 / MC09) TaxID=857087 RepID=G0A112_METMM|nr:FecR family protein [Methylomonas methanica]AEG01268.1 anti-FecI sigma factor, FecR [Methylomonas methanica MC09]